MKTDRAKEIRLIADCVRHCEEGILPDEAIPSKHEIASQRKLAMTGGDKKFESNM